MTLDPFNPQAHYEIADVLISKRKLDEAEVHLQQTLRFQPATVETYLAMEKVMTGREQYASALAYLDKAIALQPNNSTVHSPLDHSQETRTDC